MAKDGLYGRLLARAQAVQVLFQAESAGRPVKNILQGDYVVTRGPIDRFGEELALGVAEHQDELDRVIARVANNWALSRISLVDKNILRLALYELLLGDDVSASVAISEAVNLSKVFGGEDSYVFVNGVLGRVARDREKGVDFLAPEEGPAEAGLLAQEAPRAAADEAAEAEAEDAALADDAAAEAADADVATVAGDEAADAEAAEAVDAEAVAADQVAQAEADVADADVAEVL